MGSGCGVEPSRFNVPSRLRRSFLDGTAPKHEGAQKQQQGRLFHVSKVGSSREGMGRGQQPGLVPVLMVQVVQRNNKTTQENAGLGRTFSLEEIELPSQTTGLLGHIVPRDGN